MQWSFKKNCFGDLLTFRNRTCVRNLDLWVQSVLKNFGPQNPPVSKVLKASKSAGAKGDVPKIYRFVHPLHPC
jgi:hypothetical protein